MNKLKLKFQSLPLGIQRSIIVGGIICAIVCVNIDTTYRNEYGLRMENFAPIQMAIMGLIGYIIVVFTGIWIWEGFKEK